METNLYVQSLIDECDALNDMHTASINLLDNDSPVADWHRNKIKTNLKMKTLLERLRPEIMDKINADMEEYPYYTRSLIEELKSNVSFMQLTVNTASSLCALDNSTVGILELNNLFS